MSVKRAIASVVKDLATYGYRGVWARLWLEGHDRINHERVYWVARDEGWLLYRCGEKPVDTRKLKAKWLSCDNGEEVRVAFALDCSERGIMSWMATTNGINAALVGDLMMLAGESRFGSVGKPPEPIEWLTDNGSCYSAAETRSFAKHWDSSR